MTIQWGNADLSNGAYSSEVKYTDLSGNPKMASFPANKPYAVIKDMKPNTTYQFRTMFKPDSLSIDNFYTDYSESKAYTFSKKDWKIASFSDQYSTGDNAAANIIDSTDATRWHTNGSAYPHFAVIDMGAVRTVSKFGVWRTRFATADGDVRAPTRIKFLISMDQTTWTDLGEFNFNNLINGEQFYPMPGLPQGRYFKFVGLAGTDTYMTLGEITAYGF